MNLSFEYMKEENSNIDISLIVSLYELVISNTLIL